VYFSNVANRPFKELTPGVRTRTFWSNNVLVSLLDFSPNSVVPLHSHREEQVGIVLEGELYMTIGSETRLMKAGELYVIPGDVEHGGKTTDNPAKVCDVFSPIRKEYQY
jgi:quercetin dioxygenase-like cupin family protein